MSGLLALNRDAAGKPVVPAFQIADVGGGALHAVLGILMALVARERTGAGQLVDVSMVDALAPWQVFPWSYLQAGEDERGPYLSGEYPCYAVYGTRDEKYFALGALEEKFWQNFCRRVGRSEWIPVQFARGEERDRLAGEVRTLFLQKTRDEWAVDLGDADCCATPVLETAELASHPLWTARELVRPGGAAPGVLGFPIRMEGTPASVRSAPPGLGEHTDEILAGLGYAEEKRKELRREGAVA
jgi:crotonobetainyl-CoA:carnitine CoA-transferase CaiB-like acyl-CoA transferase